VAHALKTGYRLIDTAAFYGNEADVGAAVRDSGVAREEIFITTKLWNDDHGYDQALRAFDASMDRLGLDVVDLYLIHWPVSARRKDSWRALERIRKDGRARAIGVSNYTIAHLRELLEASETVPAVNQVEFSPFLYQRELLEFCRSKSIVLEAYCPLTRAERLTDARLLKIAFVHKRTAAQVMIRWGLQRGVIEIPKSKNPARIEENADVFDFELSEAEMGALDGFSEGLRVSWDPTSED
jgi:diketogulonate reductase-like aldo/keto reductase